MVRENGEWEGLTFASGEVARSGDGHSTTVVRQQGKGNLRQLEEPVEGELLEGVPLEGEPIEVIVRLTPEVERAIRELPKELREIRRLLKGKLR